MPSALLHKASQRKSLVALLSFFCVPLFPAVFLAASSPIAGGFGNFNLSSFLALTALFYIYSFALAMPIAIPAFLLLEYFNLVRWWSASAVGACAGVFIAAITSIGKPQYFETLLHASPAWAAVGVASGALFWILLRGGYSLMRVQHSSADSGL
jgi:hypothetical protein